MAGGGGVTCIISTLRIIRGSSLLKTGFMLVQMMIAILIYAAAFWVQGNMLYRILSFYIMLIHSIQTCTHALLPIVMETRSHLPSPPPFLMSSIDFVITFCKLPFAGFLKDCTCFYLSSNDILSDDYKFT